MKLSAKDVLDGELKKSQIRRLVLITVTLSLMVIGFYFSVINSKTEGSYVIGEPVSRYTRQHDEGHTNYLRVKVPTEEKLVVIRVPSTSQVMLNKNIKLSRVKYLASGKSKYVFIEYVE